MSGVTPIKAQTPPSKAQKTQVSPKKGGMEEKGCPRFEADISNI